MHVQDYMILCMRIVVHRSVLDDSPVIKIAYSLLLLLISQVENKAQVCGIRP